VVCVCPKVVAVDNRTTVHIIQHPRERHRAVGTVRFARLGLRRCVVEVCSPKQPVSSRLASEPPGKAALLFPGPDARPLESLPAEQRPDTLIVLDGTWSQVIALKRENPWLDALPRLTFAEPAPSRYIIRPEPEPGYLSTIESIVGALSILEPDTVGLDGLLSAFDAMVETQLVHCNTSRRARYIHRDGPPSTLVDRLREERERQVLVYVETTGGRGQLRLLQLCAQRLATGERLDCLCEPPDGWPAKMTHLGWSAEDRAHAVSEGELKARWCEFVRDDDLLVAWSQLTIDAISSVMNRPGGAARPLILKGVFAAQGRAPGGIGGAIARRGCVAPRAGFTGRAGRHMGQALALINSCGR